MEAGRITGATRVLGKSQGYIGLPVLDTTIHDTVNGEGTPCMVTAWIPNPDEIDRIMRGASVKVCILGSAHPPIMVGVGDPPSDEPEAA